MPKKTPRRTRRSATAAESAPLKVTISEPPATRLLRVFAFDPSLSTEMANYEVSEVVTRIPWERDRCWEGKGGKLETEQGLLPGPTGDYLEVIDVDPASGCAYEPVDLNDPPPARDQRASAVGRQSPVPPADGLRGRDEHDPALRARPGSPDLLV